ncbi:hypothetical protein EDD22DRAFT_1050541 [Suillus occidentalis]|nr:hypothetical protein EDD22DRAFT_1050541 [Suillus occidentalis]
MTPHVHESNVYCQEALSVSEPTTGSRVLYILVFRKLQPITKGVHHRDVSPANLVWYEKDGKLIGVLNDYDLSSLVDEPSPRGNEYTGTVPFMARDLLTKSGNLKLTLQTDKTVPACTHKDDRGWQFIRKCLFVLARRQFFRSEKAELTQESESESHMDEFLASLKGTEGWAKLSNPSPEQ